jgi:molybdenum cofactor cytidylyltransferase
MKLAQAFRLTTSPHLALVGAGGKTSALFHLAYQLAPHSPKTAARRVLLSASTHLATDQLAFAEHHFVLRSPKDLDALTTRLPSGVVLFTGPLTKDNRTAGLPIEILDALLELARATESPLLIEADGSRRLPLKAPSNHEPVIPEWVDHVVVVAGLSGLGKPLNSQWVHRPGNFARLSGLPAGTEVTPEALTKVLSSPLGGRKDIPNQARRTVLLNQADTPELQSQGQRIATQLLSAYHAIAIATLNPPTGTSNVEDPVFALHEPVAGIVLAAGGAKRMGYPKQTLSWRGQPLVRHVARVALSAGLNPVIVVTGAFAGQVEDALEDEKVRITYNPSWQSGQSTSVIAGLNALSKDVGAAIFLLADQPHIPEHLVRSLVEAHARSLAPIVAPLIDGQRANPVLFDRQTFPHLLQLSGDTGGRAIFSRHRVNWLPWHDASPLLDIDTPGDIERLMER